MVGVILALPTVLSGHPSSVLVFLYLRQRFRT